MIGFARASKDAALYAAERAGCADRRLTRLAN
jgi:hypothetical protein